jgi:aspartate kinase
VHGAPSRARGRHRRAGRGVPASAGRAERACLSVLKLGGSVLRDDGVVRARGAVPPAAPARRPDERLVVIVSAQYGATDDLLAEAQSHRRTTLPAALDLLWSTGELRSVALLALHLQRIGVSAVPFNVHQTGLVACRAGRGPTHGTTVRPLRLLAALAASRIVSSPLLGVSAAAASRRSARGGSDLTPSSSPSRARRRCELVKDVPGYFTADPHRRRAGAADSRSPIDGRDPHGRRGAAIWSSARALGAGRPGDLPLVLPAAMDPRHR